MGSVLGAEGPDSKGPDTRTRQQSKGHQASNNAERSALAILNSCVIQTQTVS